MMLTSASAGTLRTVRSAALNDNPEMGKIHHFFQGGGGGGGGEGGGGNGCSAIFSCPEQLNR